MFSWRLTGLIEPPPGTLASRDGSFSFTPYGGGGIGVHYIDENSSFSASNPVARVENVRAPTIGTVLGFHGLVGVDFEFTLGRAARFSAGLEYLWTTAVIEDKRRDNHDFGGHAFAVTFKFYF